MVRVAAKRGRGRAGEDTPARRARGEPGRRTRRAGELLGAGAPPSLRPARRRAAGRAHPGRAVRAAPGALRKIVPELRVADPPAEFAEIEVLEAVAGVLAGHAPVVLLLDDLQWADQATITALSYLQRRGAAIPAALVAAVRTEDAPPGHLARRLRPDTIVRLNPLTPAELAPLAVPDLHEATGGNPRFVVETMTRGSHGELPATLAETLLARCRSEGAASYRALLAASTLAQPFDPEPLAALLRADAAELTEELEWLGERRILRVDGPRFRFRYDLVREVLLASVSPARRRLLPQQPR